MHTPKASMNSSGEVFHRLSASSQTSRKSPPSTNRHTRHAKVAGSGADSASSPNSSSRTPKNKTTKFPDRGTSRSPMTEKKRFSKLSDLESQLAHLEEELKKAKNQLNSTETLKQHAMQEREEMKIQLAAMSTRLREYQHQLSELSISDDARVKEIRQLSKERDQIWQSELEAIQMQHSMDSAALASALGEIQKLKKQLEIEKIGHTEIENLRTGLSETVSLIENMRKQLNECKGSEARALQVAKESQMQLEEAMAMAESLRSEGFKAKETYNRLTSELEKSKEKTSSLEFLVKEFEENVRNRSKNSLEGDEGCKKVEATETMEVKAEVNALKLEVGWLKSTLEASELRYQEEYVQSTLQIRNAFDQVERTKLETRAREAVLEASLKQARHTIDELKLELMFKESKNFNTKMGENEIKILKGDLQDLKEVLLDKETKIQSMRNENEMLKAGLQKRESFIIEGKEQVAVSSETGRAAELARSEDLMKLGDLTEEADKSSRKAAVVLEQLEAAQTANTELEVELRRLKVQSDQWRKAAEAAAIMISTGSNPKFAECTFSRSCSYTSKADSQLPDDVDDDSPKKKNGNMLKKIGLWKKGHK